MIRRLRHRRQRLLRSQRRQQEDPADRPPRVSGGRQTHQQVPGNLGNGQHHV